MASLAPISEDDSLPGINFSIADMRDKLKVPTKTKAPRITFISGFYEDSANTKTEMIKEKSPTHEKELAPPPDFVLYDAVDNFSKALPFVYILHFFGSIAWFLYGGITCAQYIFLNHSLIFLLVIDCYTSYDQWYAMFGPKRMETVTQNRSQARSPSKPTLRRRTDFSRASQINEANPSPAQLNERAKVGIVELSHYYVSFVNYFYLFKLRLRFDFVLNIAVHLIRHGIITFLISSGINKKAFRWYPHYRKHWEKGPRACIAESCLECSIMLGLSELDEIKQKATFKYSNWVTMSNNEPDKVMSIDLFVIKVDLKTRMCTYAEVNGEEWTDMREVLQLQFLLITGCLHPIMHLYSNWFYTDDPSDPLYQQGIITLITNAVSIWGGTIAAGYKDPEPWRKVLIRNAVKGVHFHYVEDLEKFCKYSRSARFLLKARRLCKKHCAGQRPGDSHFYEAFFISSVLHNVDHAMFTGMNNPADLVYVGPHELTSAQLIRVMFCAPHVELLIYSQFKKSNVPWVKALYRDLRAVDSTFADYCHIGIRF